MVDDERTVGKHGIIGFVVCHDTFMSGWGPVENGKSFYALAVRSDEEAEIVMENANNRSEMRDVGLYAKLPTIGDNDHMRVVDWKKAPRWYEEGGFS